MNDTRPSQYELIRALDQELHDSAGLDGGIDADIAIERVMKRFFLTERELFQLAGYSSRYELALACVAYDATGKERSTNR